MGAKRLQPSRIGPYNHIAKAGQFISIGGTAGVDPATGERCWPGRVLADKTNSRIVQSDARICGIWFESCHPHQCLSQGYARFREYEPRLYREYGRAPAGLNRDWSQWASQAGCSADNEPDSHHQRTNLTAPGSISKAKSRAPPATSNLKSLSGLFASVGCELKIGISVFFYQEWRLIVISMLVLTRQYNEGGIKKLQLFKWTQTHLVFHLRRSIRCWLTSSVGIIALILIAWNS